MILKDLIKIENLIVGLQGINRGIMRKMRRTDNKTTADKRSGRVCRNNSAVLLFKITFYNYEVISPRY